jgi:hypothetical protein
MYRVDMHAAYHVPARHMQKTQNGHSEQKGGWGYEKKAADNFSGGSKRGLRGYRALARLKGRISFKPRKSVHNLFCRYPGGDHDMCMGMCQGSQGGTKKYATVADFFSRRALCRQVTCAELASWGGALGRECRRYSDAGHGQ